VQELILWPFRNGSVPIIAIVLSVIAGVLSGVGAKKSMRDCEQVPGRWPIWIGLLGMALSAAFAWSVLEMDVQRTPVVIPGEFGEVMRLLSHLSLLVLLMMVTATDLKNYDILDWNCWLGMAIAVVSSTVFGELQLEHIWVDWNQEVPQISGPYIPSWLAPHPHLHGFAWSMTGLITGAILTWLVRFTSARLLQMPTLGAGDIMLMAMIGAYLGWQATIVAFALAPMFALVVGGVMRTVSNRPALPYGPFLALGAITVLFTWKFIWMAEFSLTDGAVQNRETTFAVRRFFGDPIGMLIVAGMSFGLFVLLIGLLRIYKSLPGREEAGPVDHNTEEMSLDPDADAHKEKTDEANDKKPS